MVSYSVPLLLIPLTHPPDPAYGPNYEASYTPDGFPNGCFCKPSVCPKPCFGNKYTLPKDGSRGCCPEDQEFSYDGESLEGACCSNGTTYSFDPISRSGGCCSGMPVASFVGSCAAPTPPAPLTPCTSPFPGSVTVGGKNFVNYTGVGTLHPSVPSHSSSYPHNVLKTYTDSNSHIRNQPRWRR